MELTVHQEVSGKKKDSENDKKEIEYSLFFLFASPKTQLYIFLNKFIF